MKIGIVCFGLTFVAGGARLIFGMARSLEAEGHTVIIYTPEFKAEHYKEAAKGLDIRVIEPKKPLIWTGRPANLMAWVRNKIEKERRFVNVSRQIAMAMDPNLDILNIHDFAYRTGYFYKKRNPKTQIIWTENAAPYLFIPRKQPLANLLGYAYQWYQDLHEKRYFKAIDKVAVLDFLNEKWSEEHGFKNIAVIRCGVDFEKFYAPVKDFAEKAKKKSVQLFALGALNIYRRYDVVMRSVKILRDEGIDARAIIVAINIWEADALKDELTALARELRIEPYIDFRFAGVSDEELRKIFRESDFFVQAVYVTPPGNHGWGIVNFEGMSAGLPLILVNSATATEVLQDNENAFFMNPLAPQEIAEKVKCCIANPALYKKIAEAGQEVARRMTWEKYSKEMVEFFQFSA